MMMYQKNRVGEEYFNKLGYHMIITKYNSAKDIEVTFDNGYKTNTNFKMIKNGWVKNKLAPSVSQQGIVGELKISKNSKTLKEYRAWHGMLIRCFSKDYKANKPSYENVSCCKEWLIYENFLKWLKSQENYKYLSENNIVWHLDKDILIKGNKEYSPETCCIVPGNVNCLFVKSDAARGEYPIGVGKIEHYNSFYYRCCLGDGKRIKRCGFQTPEEAFHEYKICKESVIQEIAIKEFEKGSISERCFNAMIKYKVEITD